MDAITFDQINDHVNNADLTPFSDGGEKHLRSVDLHAAPGDALKKVCSIYHIIRPILQGVMGIPFIPKKWKDVMQTFMDIMDKVCPA